MCIGDTACSAGPLVSFQRIPANDVGDHKRIGLPSRSNFADARRSAVPAGTRFIGRSGRT
jgi:hypothetical protein